MNVHWAVLIISLRTIDFKDASVLPPPRPKETSEGAFPLKARCWDSQSIKRRFNWRSSVHRIKWIIPGSRRLTGALSDTPAVGPPSPPTRVRDWSVPGWSGWRRSSHYRAIFLFLDVIDTCFAQLQQFKEPICLSFEIGFNKLLSVWIKSKCWVIIF